MELEIIKPAIFPENEIISGITTKNIKYFPVHGFSLSNGKILSDEQVNENRNILADFLNAEPKELKFQKQVHGDHIRVIDNDSPIKESDAMITDKKNVFINILIADCTAVLLFDKQRKVIAGIHSGWRGSKLNITEKTVGKMAKEYGTVQSDLLAYVSPCASGDKYEVEKDVAELFPRYVAKISDNKYLFDNRKRVVDDLLSSGILLRNLEVSDKCTISDQNLHSHRREGDKAGRMSAFIGMI